MGCLSSKSDSMNPDEVDLTHFVLGTCIGKGGFGKVHAVLHKGSGIQMAMKRLEKRKIIRQQWQIDSVWIERNLLELLTDGCPYVSRLFFAFQTKWELFLIMPYLRGGDLSFYLNKQGKMKIATLKYYATEMLCALMELRRLGIVYRDYKPDNCIFSDDGHLVLTDFGICARLSINAEKNDQWLQDRIGTNQYMSPEQKDGGKYRYECDYWAWGLTLYEMFTGKRMLSATRDSSEETQEYFDEIVDRDITSPDLNSLIKSLLKVKNSERLGFKSIQEIQDHSFFNGVDWTVWKKGNQTEAPPYKPVLTQVNCFMDAMAMDAFGDENEPWDYKPPLPAEQKLFEMFQYNANVQNHPEWLEFWENKVNNANTNATRKRTISQLWNQPIELDSKFDEPISAHAKKRLSVMDFDINKPLHLQVMLETDTNQVGVSIQDENKATEENEKEKKETVEQEKPAEETKENAEETPLIETEKPAPEPAVEA